MLLRLADGSGLETRHAFDLEPGQQVLFGRSPDADIVIPDQNRKVSSRHGRITCLDDGSLRGFDMASLNGTYLHGAALDTEIGGDLTDGDVLRVGDFELVLTLAAPEVADLAETAPPPGTDGNGWATDQEPAADAAPAVEAGPKGDAAWQELTPAGIPSGGAAAPALSAPADDRAPDPAAGPLMESLQRAYADALQQDSSPRLERIAGALASGLGAVPGERRAQVTETLLAELLERRGWPAGPSRAGAEQPPARAALPAESPAEPIGEARVAPATAQRAQSPARSGNGASDDSLPPVDLDKTQVDHLQLLALRLVPGARLTDAEQRARFMTLVAQLSESALDWMARGLEGRAVFGQEFGAEVTLVLQRSTNPLKGMSREDLQRYLLDWKESAPPDTRRRYLDGVLEDLHEHQVGVLAGVEEAVAGVLTRLSPERVEGLAAQQKAKGWTAATRSWQTYCQLHKELTEERSKLFHELISPAIQKGYLHRHGDRPGDAASP
ncbi:MAG: FHA domain-containing protein [Planctomycetes bacterium]|nr:FHA domain-containing protein [Planctomycetota bacterium]